MKEVMEENQMESLGQTVTVQFAGQKENSNLHVSYRLTLPASRKELETFLKAAKKFTGKKEILLAEGLSAVFVRGGDIGGKIIGSRKSVQYELIEDAINDYYDIPEDSTLVFDAEEEEEVDEDADESNAEGSAKQD